jgi:hypothetical protein
MSDLATTWDEIRKLLRGARDGLAPQQRAQGAAPVPVGPLSGTLDEFEEFLDHNELELAWDALAEIAGATNAPPACWGKLAQAARLMQLPAKADEAARHAGPHVSSDQALRIARLDAQKVYGDLTPYRISLALEPDGWHVDYELKDPHVNGSGPHYVIDPVTGTIVSKRYEQ